MRSILFVITTVMGSWLFSNQLASADELVLFDFQKPETQQTTPPEQQSQARSQCEFEGLILPDEFSVFAAGAYSGRRTGFQIDQSGHEATRMDVAVNSPDKPVVLILGAYEPTIWNIGWVENTDIVAVLVSGYHRQVLSGLRIDTPTLNSSYENRGPCGHFYITERPSESLNPRSRRMFGRPVDMIYPARGGKIVIGEKSLDGLKLVTSNVTTPESFHDKDAPLAGEQGLAQAVKEGTIRRASSADVTAWRDAMATSTPRRDVPPVAGGVRPASSMPRSHNAYVVLKDFTYPSGLYGAHSATFFVMQGVPMPKGNPGHSTVYDFNTLGCSGASCRR